MKGCPPARKGAAGTVGGRALERRSRIVAAARALFLEHGFHGAGVARIAAASGVAIGQVYRDFPAKREIVVAIVERECALAMATQSLREGVASGDVEAVARWIRGMAEPTHLARSGALFAEMVAESTRDEGIARILAHFRGEAVVLVEAALDLPATGAMSAERRATLAEIVVTQSLGMMQSGSLRPTVPSAVLEAFVFALLREIDKPEPD